MKYSRPLAFFLLLIWMTPVHTAILSAKGSGQVLLFPFVTSEGGWDTYLGLNLDRRGGHVVRLRFMDPRDGLPMQTFNIYSSFGENWRAAVTATESGPVLRIAEGSCTIADSGQHGGVGTDFSLQSSLAMLEVYSVTKVFTEYYQFCPAGEPSEVSCADLAQRFEPGGLWEENPVAGFEEESLVIGEVSGYFDLVDVQKGLSAALPATAIKQFTDDIAHTAPTATKPDLRSADPVAVLADGSTFVRPPGEGLEAVALLLSPPSFVSDYFGTSRRDIENDVITSEAIRASTDWVVSYPLRGYEPDFNYNAEVNGEQRECETSVDRVTGDSFVEVNICDLAWAAWGAGEYVAYDDFCPSPTPIGRYRPIACNAVNSIAFGERSPIFLKESSEYQYRMSGLEEFSFSDANLTVGYDLKTGWARQGQAYSPVLGFRATTFLNGTLEGGSVLANYMTLRPHASP